MCGQANKYIVAANLFGKALAHAEVNGLLSVDEVNLVLDVATEDEAGSYYTAIEELRPSEPEEKLIEGEVSVSASVRFHDYDSNDPDFKTKLDAQVEEATGLFGEFLMELAREAVVEDHCRSV